MKGIGVSIYRTNAFGDATNGGISSKVNSATLIGEGMPELFEPDTKSPGLRIVKRMFGSRPYYHCEPLEGRDPKNVGWMFGGNFVYTSDSRYNRLTNYPMPIHDRQESQSSYDALTV